MIRNNLKDKINTFGLVSKETSKDIITGVLNKDRDILELIYDKALSTDYMFIDEFYNGYFFEGKQKFPGVETGVHYYYRSENTARDYATGNNGVWYIEKAKGICIDLAKLLKDLLDLDTSLRNEEIDRMIREEILLSNPSSKELVDFGYRVRD